MDMGTVLSVAQTLFASLQCWELREMCSFLGYQSELDDLQKTVSTVNSVLLDAESKGELSNQAQLYIEELKHAVYDADDLLDEFVTLAQRKHKQLLLKEGVKFSNKVRLFLSRFKDIGVAYSMSQGVRDIRKKLDSIADNHNKFGFKLDSQHIRKRREETCSYVYAHDIIGREADKEEIVGMLLDSSTVQRDVSFLTIVGMGGLGKTTLAQLVYNDQRVTKEFPSKFWACVSDEDPKYLNVKAVLGMIMGSITGNKHDECTMDWLQGQVREQLARNKYLLVLDDVWNEDRNEWLELEKFFKEGQSGSWVMVTTRSRNTARIVGDGSSYDLKGLSNEDSWCLFERTAFGQGEGQANPPALVEIGQEIVKKCANVPLAIRIAGSLLYGQEKDKWLSFQEIGLAGARQDENRILSILKLSYHNLESHLKSCFSYCALFPKDYEIDKEMLISLWMAQGYIVPFDEGQSMDDASEEYFSILLRRCFFQEVRKNEYGEIISCKIHDLMHDVALEVARKEVCAVNFVTSDLDLDKIRHLFVVKSMSAGGSWTKSKVRTLLYFGFEMELPVGTLLGNWMFLRALNLRRLKIKSLPDTIGKLLHLRYLDLSWNYGLETLPKSITELHNLQTLKLYQCERLKELPKAFSKLVKLRSLDTSLCKGLTHMPWGMGKLSCLHTLTMFTVDVSNSGCVDHLQGLKALTKLKGCVEINIRNSKDARYVKGSDCEGGYLMNKPHLNQILFRFEDRTSGATADSEEEALMESMKPHCNLKRLEIENYDGERMPRWAREDNLATFLPSLVRIKLNGCHGVQVKFLPPLGKLHNLRFLTLVRLTNLEYMENNNSSDLIFFPSLKVMELQFLPKLKGWWRGVPCLLPSFSQLSKLVIEGCRDLTSIPPCPSLELLELHGFNERLRIMGTGTNNGNSKLRRVKTDNGRFLKSELPMEAFQSLTDMVLRCDVKLESLEQVGDVFRSCVSSLRSLTIGACPNLTLNLCMPWKNLHQSLRSLELDDLPKMVNLPEGIQHLTSLQSLVIRRCEVLESVPEWMQKLTSLTRLEVRACSEDLMQRCRSPSGADYPNIRHISHVLITKHTWW